MNNYLKILTCMLAINIMVINAIDDILADRYAIKISKGIQDVAIQNKSSYDLYVGANNEVSKNNMQYLGIGYDNRQAIIPMRVQKESGADRYFVKLNIIASFLEGYTVKDIKKTILLYGTKNAFEQLQKIGIDYSKVFTLAKKGKFTLSFEPKNLGISYKK